MRKIYQIVFISFLILFPLTSDLQILVSYHQERADAATGKLTEELEEVVAGWLYSQSLDALPVETAYSTASFILDVPIERAEYLINNSVKLESDYRELGEWVKANTAEKDRVIINNPHFKIEGERELGEQIIPDDIPGNVKRCYQELDPVCLITGARDNNAQFIVVVQGFPDLLLPIVFENDTYRVYSVE